MEALTRGAQPESLAWSPSPAAELLTLHIAPSKPTHPPSGAGLVSPRPTELRQARRFSIGGNVVPTLHVSGSQCHDWASFSLPNCERGQGLSTVLRLRQEALSGLDGSSGVSEVLSHVTTGCRLVTWG